MAPRGERYKREETHGAKKTAQWQKWCRVCHLKCRKQERTGKKCYLLMHFDDVQTGKCTLSVSSIIHFGAMIYSAASFYHSTVHYPNLVPRHPLCPPPRHYQIPHGGPLERARAAPNQLGWRAVPTLSAPLSFRLRWHYEPHYLASTHHPHVLHFARVDWNHLFWVNPVRYHPPNRLPHSDGSAYKGFYHNILWVRNSTWWGSTNECREMEQ